MLPSPSAAPAYESAPPRAAVRGPLIACSLATFLLLVYTSIVTVSVPVIVADLGANFAVSQWIIDVYTLMLAALVLGLGTLGDRWGHRRLFLVGLGVFAAASVACAAAPSGGLLVAARAVQGLGGAAIFATAVPLLTRCYSGRARATAFAVWGAVAGVGSTAGTIAGGAVTEFVSWRWLFVGALPFCLIALVVGAVSLPRTSTGGAPVDWWGTALITTAMTGLTFGAINAGEAGWSSPGTVLGVVMSVVAVGLFVPVQRRVAHPILPASLFATRGFAAVLITGFCYYFGAFAALPVLSRWLQGGQGMRPLQAALVLTVQLLAFIVVSLLFSARLHKVSRGWVLGGGTVLIGLACLSGVALELWPTWIALIVALVGTGVGAGVVSPVLPAIAATSAPVSRAGTAAAAANAIRQLGLTIGIAVCGAVAQKPSGVGDSGGGVVAALLVCGCVALFGGMLGGRLLRGGAHQGR
ncbi:MFS transporter [Nocardia sp. NPDC003482]